MNSAIGPYKGGLRFHSTVYLGLLKFLAFEQVLKNSLTTLPMGAAKGGSDFDPHGKSDMEVMRFCQSFMTELYRHIGPEFTDVPAGDIGVGGREIGYLFGQYKRIANEFTGVLTGKGAQLGRVAHQARGHRLRLRLLRIQKCSRRGAATSTWPARPASSRAAGNVAQFAIEKILAPGGKGLRVRLRRLHLRRSGHRPGRSLAQVPPRAARTSAAAASRSTPGRLPRARSTPKLRRDGRPLDPQWDHPGELRLPLRHSERDQRRRTRRNLLGNGDLAGGRGFEHVLPTIEGREVFLDAGILYAPGKAANAGGVATSGLEMSQNSLRTSWSREEVDQQLQRIMKNIHSSCLQAAEAYDKPGNYVVGANVAGFLKVADSMMDQGLI